MSFKNDTQGKDTQLYPLVVIERNQDEDEHIFISTNNVTVDGNYYKPILLNLPSISESINTEDKKFTISSVSLDISNLPYKGKRLSDIICINPIINTVVSIHIKSPSCNSVTMSWQGDPDPNDGCPRIYTGIIRKITHDNKKLKITLEDSTQNKAKVSLPSQSFDDSENIHVDYRNKPKPMVYGYVDKCPLSPINNNHDFLADYTPIIGEYTDQNKFGYNETALWIGDEGNYINVQTYSDLAGYEADDVIQFTIDPDSSLFKLKLSNRFIFPADATTPPTLFIHDRSNNIQASLFKRATPTDDCQEELTTEDFLGSDLESFNNAFNGKDDPNDIEIYNQIEVELFYANSSDIYRFTQLLLELELYYNPNYEVYIDDAGFNHLSLLGMSINNKNMNSNIPHLEGSMLSPQGFNPILSRDVAGRIGLEDSASHAGDEIISPGENLDNTISDHYQHYGNMQDDNMSDNQNRFNWNQLINFKDIDNNPDADLDLEISITEQEAEGGITIESFLILLVEQNFGFSLDGSAVAIGGSPGSIILQFRAIMNKDQSIAGTTTNYTVDLKLDGDLRDISLLRAVTITDFFNKKYYASIRGRKNIVNQDFDAHNNPYLGDEDFISNPIDIVYDLVRRELGIEDIDYDSYIEAKEAHFDWQFGFTLNEEKDAKDLIEDICKSTKSFARFKSDGSFGFETIKNHYNISGDNNDYENAYLIKDQEVINYKFTKTSPQKIYQKVIISYKKDYSTGDYLKKYEKDLGPSDFYGIQNSDNATFKLESDYIRQESVAKWLGEYILEQFKNDHLIMDITLPLSYVDLEVGSIIKFNKRIQGTNAYGIAYDSGIQFHNFQNYYPLFMITSIRKKINSIAIKAQQLHMLSTSEYPDAVIDEGWADIGDDEAPVIHTSDGIISVELEFQESLDGITSYWTRINIPDVSATDNDEPMPQESITTTYPEDALLKYQKHINIPGEEGWVDIDNPEEATHILILGVGLWTFIYTVTDASELSSTAINQLQSTIPDDYEFPLIESSNIRLVSIPNQPVVPYIDADPNPEIKYGVPHDVHIHRNKGQIDWIWNQPGEQTGLVAYLELQGEDNWGGIEQFITPGMRLILNVWEEGHPPGAFGNYLDLNAIYLDRFDGNKMYIRNTFEMGEGRINHKDAGGIDREKYFTYVLISQVLNPDDYEQAQASNQSPDIYYPEIYNYDDFEDNPPEIWKDTPKVYKLEVHPDDAILLTMVGDSNLDGFVNILDIVGMVNYIIGVAELNNHLNADLNGDGFINILDIVQMVHLILGTDPGGQ